MPIIKDNKVKSNFEKISISLASPEDIKERSSGEVIKPETVNYRTYKPERDGLFCEKIFGPTKDYECHCGKYKRIRYRGTVCDRCGVEVTEKKVRRERIGHIELVVPVAHIWYFRSSSNKIAAMLGMSAKDLDAVIYYERYVVADPGILGEGIREDIRRELKLERPLRKLDLLTEDEYLKITELLEDSTFIDEETKAANPVLFKAGMGAEVIYDLLKEIDVEKLANELREKLRTETV